MWIWSHLKGIKFIIAIDLQSIMYITHSVFLSELITVFTIKAAQVKHLNKLKDYVQISDCCLIYAVSGTNLSCLLCGMNLLLKTN